MGVIKNEVGRPSNKTIVIRRILKFILLLIIIALAVLIGYYLNEKETRETDNTNKNDIKKSTTTTTTAKKEEDSYFDKSKVTTKVVDGDGLIDNPIAVYVYGNRLDPNKYETNKINSITPIDDVAVIELESEFDILLLVNKKGEVIYDFERSNDYYYCSDSNYSSECYQYKVSDNTIKYMVSNMGQDSYGVCVTHNNENVLMEYEIKYENGKLSQPKKISSMIGSEYVSKHNIDCLK